MREPSSRRFVPTLVAVAVLALVGAGCQENPEPPPISADETWSSPSPSPSPSPAAPPSMPAEARGTSEASAKAFVRHYFRTLNYAMNQGAVDQLRALSDEACESCETIAKNIERTYQAGGEISSKGWLVRSVNFVPEQRARTPIVDIGVLISSERVIERAGARPRTFPGGRQPMTMYLRWESSSGWRVLRLDRVS